MAPLPLIAEAYMIWKLRRLWLISHIRWQYWNLSLSTEFVLLEFGWWWFQYWFSNKLGYFQLKFDQFSINIKTWIYIWLYQLHNQYFWYSGQSRLNKVQFKQKSMFFNMNWSFLSHFNFYLQPFNWNHCCETIWFPEFGLKIQFKVNLNVD